MPRLKLVKFVNGTPCFFGFIVKRVQNFKPIRTKAGQQPPTTNRREGAGGGGPISGCTLGMGAATRTHTTLITELHGAGCVAIKGNHPETCLRGTFSGRLLGAYEMAVHTTTIKKVQ